MPLLNADSELSMYGSDSCSLFRDLKSHIFWELHNSDVTEQSNVRDVMLLCTLYWSHIVQSRQGNVAHEQARPRNLWL